MFSPTLQLPFMFFGILLLMETIAFSQCIEKERQALLEFKQGLLDPSNRLSSWTEREEDCCQWDGIKCDNKTGHVVILDLHNPDQLTYDDDGYLIQDREQCLGGQIQPSLLALQSLSYLDLSFNNFTGITIPKFLGSFPKLRYLNLSNSCFVGRFPSEIGNLSNLLYLDVNTIYDGECLGPLVSDVSNLDWLSGLTSLRYLDMSKISLQNTGHWLHIVNQLPTLRELRLKNCRLDKISSSVAHANLTSLRVLDLSANYLYCSSFKYLWNMTSLLHLDVSHTNMQCSIPDGFRNLTSLAFLDLSRNMFQSSIPAFFDEMTSLEYLDLSNNAFRNPIPDVFGKMVSLAYLDLSNNAFRNPIPDVFGKMVSLAYLDLSSNQFTGFLPNSVGKLTSLKYLSFRENQLNGSLPESIGHLSELVALDVASNVLEGVILESHFSNLSKLRKLDVSFNSVSLEISFGWIPPFQLNDLRLQSCSLGPNFPAWLRTQTNLSYLELSNTSIVDTIPNWFWNISSYIKFINLSDNHLYGQLPNLSTVFSTNIDLSSNHLDGLIPQISSNVSTLNLSKNLFSGSISNLLCKASRSDNSLQYLDLSDNILSGRIPDCFMYWQHLYVLNLGNNIFSGEIPVSIGYMDLRSLHLQNNNFSGELPMTLKNCSGLLTIDVAANRLSGRIPPWIGGESMSSLMLLRLRSNHFQGDIPTQLCELTSLQILDLAQNYITGNIPRCFQNLRTMTITNDLTESSTYSFPGDVTFEEKTTIVWKGRESEYQNTLGLVTSMDLSSNYLSGEIPGEMMDLVGILSLNLSRNLLFGKIPNSIGNMEVLESLDFSYNQLSDVIPLGVADLTKLSYFVVSYNNLSGAIPTSSQLQSFDESSFTGNPLLCGPPLLLRCTNNETYHQVVLERDVEVIYDESWFYIGMGMGYITGFVGVCVSFLINHSWRNAYSGFINEVKRLGQCCYSC